MFPSPWVESKLYRLEEDKNIVHWRLMFCFSVAYHLENKPIINIIIIIIIIKKPKAERATKVDH